MICARCNHFAAAPGGPLCAQCAVAPPPPGLPSVGTMGTPGPWLRSPVGLGRAAAAALGLVVAADLFAVWADFLQLDIASDLMGGAQGAEVTRRAEHADNIFGISGGVQILTLVISTVVYLCWFYRVRVNAEVFDQSAHSKSRGWAIGGWFTPVANLWFPRRIALDIWDASTPWGERRSHGLVNAWWSLWLLSIVAGRSVFTSNNDAESASELHQAAGMMLFADVVDIVTALLAIAVVLRLTRMQHQKALAGPVPV
ncbi:DUF4328 domain-containing protein [Streptomyces sp. NPDC042207]|uniref:DUF4328 domain-containing protein n=1 Tax=Streptomyces sp. NPDC042207 TaxID=3154331 RepID=UPI0033CBE632